MCKRLTVEHLAGEATFASPLSVQHSSVLQSLLFLRGTPWMFSARLAVCHVSGSWRPASHGYWLGTACDLPVSSRFSLGGKGSADSAQALMSQTTPQTRQSLRLPWETFMSSLLTGCSFLFPSGTSRQASVHGNKTRSQASIGIPGWDVLPIPPSS